MRVKIHNTDFSLSNSLNDYINTKIRLVLGPYVNKVSQVDVFLSDEDSPKGGIDLSCKINASLEGLPPIFAQVTTADIYDAINLCLHKVKRATERSFKRTQQYRRSKETSFV